MTPLELLDREIKKLEAALEYAMVKPKTMKSDEEIDKIRTMLDLKREIREVVRKALAM